MKGVDEWPRGRQQACSKEQDLGEQRLTRPLALGVLSPDGISSSAYGTEEILIALLPLAGLAAFTLILPMTLVILFVMVLVLLSYREIVMVYIRPGGSYVVARENFGPRIAQICAVALLIDYIVTVAVQTAAGTAAVASAFPSIGPYKLEITVGVVLLMAFGNLRGLRAALPRGLTRPLSRLMRRRSAALLTVRVGLASRDDELVRGIGHDRSTVLDADRTPQPDPGAAHQAGNAGPAVEHGGQVPGGIGNLAGQHRVPFHRPDLHDPDAALDGGLARLVK
jgi:hypothetical protein